MIIWRVKARQNLTKYSASIEVSILVYNLDYSCVVSLMQYNLYWIYIKSVALYNLNLFVTSAGITIVRNVLLFLGFFNNYLPEIPKYGKTIRDRTIYLNQNYYHILYMLIWHTGIFMQVMHYNYRSALHPCYKKM